MTKEYINAFPFETLSQSSKGMSLRAYIAANAPPVPKEFERLDYQENEVIENPPGRFKVAYVTKYEPIEMYHARWAVEYADALLKELER